MSALFFALPHEAKPWIEAMKLKPEKKQGHFRFYHNEKHTVVVSGPGKLAMAMAVTELAFKLPKEKRHPGFRVWNLGICGSANTRYAIGDFFWINKIHDFGQNRDYYPERFESWNVEKETHLTTFDRPISKDINSDSRFYQQITQEKCEQLELIDMEASGFFEAASIYFELSQIKVGKILSDFLEGSLCSAQHVSELLAETKNLLFDAFESEGTNLQNPVLNPEEWEKWEALGKNLHFTESMLVELKKSILYYRLRYPENPVPLVQKLDLNRPFEKKDAKEVFSLWKSLLYA
jgi:hypothetical protein